MSAASVGAGGRLGRKHTTMSMLLLLLLEVFSQQCHQHNDLSVFMISMLRFLYISVN